MENKFVMRSAKTPEDEERVKAMFAEMRRKREERAALLPQIRIDGEAALRRLLPIAKSDTGQSGVIARFLLSVYNGDRFPFDLTDFRRLDGELFDDCIAVLKMDSQPLKEVHKYFDEGNNEGDKIWKKLIADWNFTDYGKQEKSWR